MEKEFNGLTNQDLQIITLNWEQVFKNELLMLHSKLCGKIKFSKKFNLIALANVPTGSVFMIF